jgi:exopolysaccharide production protein ExoZ
MIKNKINSLQLLRAVAVSLVIFIHLINYVDRPTVVTHSIFYSFFQLRPWGAIGVDLFFTISGFIMTVVTPSYQASGKWKDFLIKRGIRIIPLYYLVSLIFALVYVFHNHIMPNLVGVLKTLFFIPFFDKHVFSYPIVAVGWSLSYEVYFYLLIALFLALKGNVYKKLLITILILSTVGVIVNPENTLLKFLTSPILIEFALGVSAGLLYRHLDAANNSNIKWLALGLITIGVAGMVATIFTGSFGFSPQEAIENNNHLALLRSVIWGMPCASLLLGVVLWERATQMVIPAFLIVFGDASYSAYLIHSKVYFAYSKVFAHIKLNDTIFVLTALPVCLIVSVIFYKLIERPITNAVNNFYSKIRSAKDGLVEAK